MDSVHSNKKAKSKKEINYMPNKVFPIKPGEVSGLQEQGIPDVIFEVVNDLIVKEFSGRSAMVLQKDIVAQLQERGLKSEEIYENRWLDFEGVYRKSGWKVVYDKPHYHESYDASF